MHQQLRRGMLGVVVVAVGGFGLGGERAVACETTSDNLVVYETNPHPTWLGFIAPELAANAQCTETTRPRNSWATTPVPLLPHFDVVTGPTTDGKDMCAQIRSTKPDSGTLEANSDAGFVYQVNSGYGVASGKFPVLAGRRVRAASDGTQFAIEVLSTMSGLTEEVTERVYFLTSTSGLPVNVRYYGDENQAIADLKGTEAINLAQYIEFKWTKNGGTYGNVSNGGAKMINDPLTPVCVKYFAAQMGLLLIDPGFPPEQKSLVAPINTNIVDLSVETAAQSLNGCINLAEARPGNGSLMSRFAAQFADKRGDKEFKIRTIAPIGGAIGVKMPKEAAGDQR